MSGVTLHHGDCLDVLKTLPDNSVDSVVTDPPYNLSFMGRQWDSHATPIAFQSWCALWAAECLRVLKPGGHMLAFGGTRTFHRLTVAVEDAGFEIRDSIAWLYGSGFPKSLDVSKAIDKRRDDLADVRIVAAWLCAELRATDIHHTTVAEHFGVAESMVRHWIGKTGEKQTQCPKWDQWIALKALIGFGDDMDAEVWRLNGRKGSPGEAWGQRPPADYATGVGMADSWTDGKGWNGKASRGGEGVTDDARTWQGWGTALKPAFEPIVVARKPLIGTVAANVLTHGTGALNVDGCRIGDGSDSQGARPEHEASAVARYTDKGAVNLAATPGPRGGSPTGRWPANVVLDESQAEALDEQSGTLHTQDPATRNGRKSEGWAPSGTSGREVQREPNGNGGLSEAGTGASRFFYTAKADASERVKVDGIAHPTVKPLSLMRWLVRLVTPPGGTVLEPFAGSGTTVEACILEGFQCVAIEREADYLPLIRQRINRRRDPVAAIKTSGEDGGLFDLLDGPAA